MHPSAALDPCTAIQLFLTTAGKPELLDPGDEPIPLFGNNFVVTARGSSATIECWTETRNLVRRVRRVVDQRPGRLDLEVERFGNRTATLILLDRAHPSNTLVTRHGVRMQYRERFRLSLRRQFPDWKVAEISTEPDLHHSLSPSYPRALLRKGTVAFAAIGASADCLNPSGALTFGLIWLDHIRKREKRLGVEGLAIVLPAGLENATCHRIRYLDTSAARYAVFVHHPGGHEDPVNPSDYSNLDTQLEPFRQPLCHTPPELQAAIHHIATLDGIEQRARPNGSVSLSVRGLEFAHCSWNTLTYGIEERRQATSDRDFHEIEQLAHGIRNLRQPGAEDCRNPLYLRHPEAWLESQVRSRIENLDASLLPNPIYSQAPHLAGGDRGIVDLLACDHTGRLAVIEIKASEDIHLPLQALDYWMHVKWHLDRGEFTANGYFPGVPLQSAPPKLLMVAPALNFHPSNQTVLRYFSREVPAERVGVGLEWRQELKVMYRAPSSTWPSQS